MGGAGAQSRSSLNRSFVGGNASEMLRVGDRYWLG